MTFQPKGKGKRGEPRELEEVYEGLTCTDLEPVGGYTLEEDDPANFTDKLTYVDFQRQWPDKAYPKGSDLDDLIKQGGTLREVLESVDALVPSFQPGAGPVASTSQDTGAQGAVGGAPQVPQGDQVNPAMLAMHQSIRDAHSNILKMAEKAGIQDLCTSEKQNVLENVLKNISAENLKCRVCKKTYSTTQHLRNHIKTKHIKKTPYQCTTCLKYYGDSSALKEHELSHDPTARRYKCPYCPREFLKKSKLDQHQPTHQGKTFICPHCQDKSYFYLKGLQAHIPTCPMNPDRKPKEKKYKCRLCGRGYEVERSLHRHMREQHDGAPTYV